MPRLRGAGCLFVITTLLVTCLLFLANQSVVAILFRMLAVSWPGIFNSQGAQQFIMFVGPVLLIFVEWWLIDSLLWKTIPEDADEAELDA